jgi:AmmeMemoRadiSam system protein A
MSEAPLLITTQDKMKLLDLARKTIVEYIRHGKVIKPDPASFNGVLSSSVGAFVSLHTVKGELRGCIGRFLPEEPLYKIVMDLAIASSTHDHRFRPIKKAELNNILIEISLLSPLIKITDISEIQLGKHGIYMKKDGKTGTFLPQVALENGWDIETFLGHCARDKAGIGWFGWRDAELFIYQAEVFDENIRNN